MEIPLNIKQIISKLYSNKLVGLEELEMLDYWLAKIQLDENVEAWLADNWKQASDLENDISFADIKARIKKENDRFKRQKIRHYLYKLQKIAAILLLPVLLVTSWLLIENSKESNEWFTLSTLPGERTHIVLPDGSEVWINVASQLEYPSSFNQNNRSLKLQGEAFFKVAKGQKLPFEVSAKDFKVKAIGTEFNISAYTDESKSMTFLEEGIVELTYAPLNQHERVFEMKPGEKTIIDSNEETIKLLPSSDTNYGNWRSGELYFDNEPMDAVFRKIERWYNVKIHFKSDEYEGETLVVNLEEGETIERLFEIIDNAVGIEIRTKQNEYWVTKRTN
ncbi:FecR family protein [Sunxiuqinia sp. A32]|uniref:FecR family protein n=1 Tax=Sunxiuqinia sp. A32 TaxID=3461496 RepID=UPI0040451F1B